MVGGGFQADFLFFEFISSPASEATRRNMKEKQNMPIVRRMKNKHHV
jgi:hypothetical protein